MTSKQLHDAVADRVKRMGEVAEGDLMRKLDALGNSLLYSAPEQAGDRARQARHLLEFYVGDPTGFPDGDWRARVAAIWQEPWPA